MTVSLKARPQGEPLRTSDNKKDLWACGNAFPLLCVEHPGEKLFVPCGRWRACRGCALRTEFQLRQRFMAGIEQVPAGKFANFFTLTFPASAAPTEAEAHGALRSLVRRLRYRDQLGAYGWVLHRTRAETLHYHGIAHMPWLDDGLAEWRELLVASGFGVQNKLLPARPQHAGYCARYLASRLAKLAPLRRAYSFSRNFPLSHYDARRREIREAGAAIGMQAECEWVPAHTRV